MRYLNVFLLLFLVLSCNDEPVSVNGDGPLTVFGRIVAPNSVDPIPFANVQLTLNNEVVSATQSDAKGHFSIHGVNYGSFELKANKGLFKTSQNTTFDDQESEFDLGDIVLDNIPQIGVVTGAFDNIESVLYDIGLVNPLTGDPLFDIIDGESFNRISDDHPRHLHAQQRLSSNPLLEPNVDFDFNDLLSDSALLSSYDILFLNCGLNTSGAEDSTAIYDYVNGGGILYATDWAYPFLEQINLNSETEYLTFLDPYKSGVSLETEATILSSELNDWLGLNFDLTIDNTVVIDEFLGSWQVVESYNPTTTLAWLNGSVDYNDGEAVVTNDKELAFTYLVGDGGVFYSSFHTENHEEGFTCVDRVMEYMVFELATLKE